MEGKGKKILKKIFKIFAWIIISIFLLLLVVTLLIQIPAIQHKITQKAITYLEEKIGTKVTLDNLYISFPKNIVLKGLYMEDQSRDTLLYAGRLFVNTNLWALTKKEIQLNNVKLENTTAFVKRADGDSTFNFSYIVEAFAGDSTAVPDTLEEKGWDFKVKKVQLDDIRTHYHDKLTGNHLDLRLGAFDIKMDEFDLMHFKFSIDKVSLEDTRVDFVQTKLVEPEIENDTTAALAIALNLNQADLKNLQANYKQEVTGQVIRLNLGESSLKANNIDLINRILDIETFSLEKTFIAYQQLVVENPAKEKAEQEPGKDGETNHWKVTLEKLDLADNSIQYYDLNKPYTRNSVDFDHLWITDLTVNVRDLNLDEERIAGQVREFSFHEKSGFTLKSLSAMLDVTEHRTDLNDFILVTNNSRLVFNARAEYESLATLSKTYATAKICADLEKSHIGVRDILYFNPTLLDSLSLNVSPQMRIHADASLQGRIGNLLLHHLNIKALSNTYLQARGTLAGMPDAKKMRMNITLDKFYTTQADINAVLPDTLVPESIALPEWLNLNAEYTGSLDKGEFKTLLATSIGAAELNGKMDIDSSSATRGYQANLAVNDFNVGALLKNPVMGKVTMHAAVNSKGLTREEMNSTVKATIDSFLYQGYQYRGFKLEGEVHQNIINGWARSQDHNLDFAIEGNINYQKDVPHYKFLFDLKRADFNALRLSERPLKARGTVDVDMATADMRILNGSLDIRKFAIYNGDALYAVDSLLFASVDQTGRSEIKIDSDIMEGKFEGTINVFTMPAVIREYFNTYYELHDSVEQSYEPPQRFDFRLKLKKTDLLTDIIIPQLENFNPGEIKGTFDSEKKQLDLRFDIADIQYAKIAAKSFLFTTNSDSTSLNYNLHVDKIRIDTLRIDGLEFNGTVSHDSIRTNLVILDSLDKHKYLIGGAFFSINKQFEFKLNPNEVKLNYEKWDVPPDNYIRFGGPKLVAQNVNLVNGEQRIILESKEQLGSPLYVGFRELSLETIASMVAQEKVLTGLLHGDINLYPDEENFRFTSSVVIQDFNIAEFAWGDVGLGVSQTTPDRYDVNFSLTGNNNNVRSVGYYVAGDVPGINLTTTISQFNLAALQPLAATQVRDLKGILSGQMVVAGTVQKPKIDGAIWFRDTHFHSTYLNTAFNIKEENISFDNQGIKFDRFELRDEKQNVARLEGAILTTDYSNFIFRLDFKTENFRLLNSTKKDNKLFYGKVGVNANARIRGTMVNPAIDMAVSLTEGSALTYVVPQNEATIMETQGIVKFVDKSFKGDKFMQEIQLELADTVKSQFAGVDLTAKIELSDTETFTIIVDPTTDDQLTIKGNTTLVLQMNRTGDMQLAGRYEISEGTYNLSFYKFLKREFSIEKGSTITWTGDPLNALMDIEAKYEVETTPVDLMVNQITSKEEANQYKKQVPFWVYLKLGGQLLKPDISFRLEMPMEERNAFGGGVYARLMDINTRESDLNKQVFALLILKRFISDNPFENQGSDGFEGTARSSVSKILTEQLNRLSENVRGVELSFDVKSYEDYTSGRGEGQTELQLGVSKTLFNDRLVVKLSGNIDIEGENTNRDPTDYIGDLALEYLITEDGRFRITGFRNSNFDMIDGELIESGAGLIYIKDYNTLRELFKPNAKKKK